jgi:glycosyltransferase involved in cell wall biosynthesis
MSERPASKKVALFLPSLSGGGAEKVMVNLARGFVERGLRVDLVLAKAEGPYLSQVPKEVRVVDLGARRVLYSLPGLVRYLRRERPQAMLSALNHANVVAIWAKSLTRVKIRLVVAEHNTLSLSTKNSPSIKGRLMPLLIKTFYPQADAIVAVSHGVAEDLVTQTGLPREKVKVIYNPVVAPELFAKAEEPLDHPWFRPGEPPVILGVGRLTKQKDFPTLIRAFALVRKECRARLMILGEGEDRPKIEALVRELGLEEDVAMPGFVDNPYKYIKRAVVFVLSSQWEGLPTVLIEALALGTPVISTDCPGGSREILGVLGAHQQGKLVPPADPKELAKAILAILEDTSMTITNFDMTPFTIEYVTAQYLALFDKL